MTCKVQILAPILVGKEIKTSGTELLPDDQAEVHEQHGRVLIIERNGQEVQWAGCCDGGHAADHEHGD